MINYLKDSRTDSVIDRGSWTTEIKADSKQLLEIFRNHSSELSNGTPMIYKLKDAG